jgi:hypothetical protein
MDPIQTPPQMPQMAPQDPSMMQGGQPVTEEQKQALLDLINKVKSQLSNVAARQKAGSIGVSIDRQQVLKEVFDSLTRAGVDLSSRESVAAFIEKLKQESPELAAMFEQAMNELMGGDAMGTQSAPPAEPAVDESLIGGNTFQPGYTPSPPGQLLG